MSSSSMHVAKTGLNAHQTKMQVIANNLSNVNTSGFKRDRANFESLLYQIKRASGEQTSVDTNLTSAFLTLSIAGKAMLSQGHGRMVFMSSVAGSLGLVNHEAISAAKGGIESMVRSAAATYANRGLRINAVAPGLTDTKLASPIMSNETASQAASQKIPIKRVGSKEEVANVIKWLLTEAPENFTGQILHTDGGMSNVLV